MSKVVASSSSLSHTGPPLQNSRPKLQQNGSSRPWQSVSALPNGLKTKEELALVDPDDLFAKYTVHEVKSMLHRLRSDVDAKQEELRLMVGERYRDLLQASTSIIAMSQSSKRVLDTVIKMKASVSIDPQAKNVSATASKRSETEDSQLKTLQCLAAHLKLLLDSPEHLWRFLERKRCLHAAWLFLLSRVVYRSLVNEGPEEGQEWVRQGIHVKEQFPLVQRQWESVAQFRTQISHRATLSLREQSVQPQDICASLLALHLLDSLPLTDGLDIFLKQRSRTLQLLYETIKESESPDTSSSRTEGHIKHSTRGVWDIFRSVLDALMKTVGSAREVFRERADGSPPMILQVLMFTQTELAPENASLPPELCISSQTLLSSLPNSNHFLALPADIRSYRPFIDLESPSSSVKAEVLTTRLRTWFTKATSHLHASASSWLSRLDNIKKIWDVRTSALAWISTSSSILEIEDTNALCSMVDEVCRTRVQDVWKAALAEIALSFDETLRSLALVVSEEGEGSQFDISPAEFLLTAPPAPSVTQSNLNVPLSQSSFQRFKHNIKLRMDGTTPFIDKILSDAESAALSLRDDLDFAFADDKSRSILEILYVSDSEETTGQLLSSVERLYDVENGDSDQSLRSLYFLGRVAQKLSTSPLISNMRCSVVYSDDCHVRIRRMYNSCIDKCASSVALSAVDKLLLRPIPKPLITKYNPTSTSPSSQMMESLLFLADAIQNFGLFKDDTQRSACVRAVLLKLLNAITDSLRKTSAHADLQSIWDLYFLYAMCVDWGSSLSAPLLRLEETIKDIQQTLLLTAKDSRPDLEVEMRRSASQGVKRVRLLLSPLIPPLDLPSSVKSPNSPTLDFGRQKAVNGPLGKEREVQTSLNLVKPSARFGSLWVATTDTGAIR